MTLFNFGKVSKTIEKKTPAVSKKPNGSNSDDILRHQAFDNTVQANIISIISDGKIIMVNRSACKLLGYTKKELLTQSRSTIFDMSERSFRNMFKQKKTEMHSEAVVTAIKKSGKPFPCKITSAIFKDKDGVKKSITTITDMRQTLRHQEKIDHEKEKAVADNIVLARTKQQEIDFIKDQAMEDSIVLARSEQQEIDFEKEIALAENIVQIVSKQRIIDVEKEKIVADDIVEAQTIADGQLAESNEWIRNIAKTSYDVMWDWNIATGKMYVGDSMEEVFGYKIKDNSMDFPDFIGCLQPKEKVIVEKHIAKVLSSGKKYWNESFMFKRLDGTFASTVTRASILRDENKKAVRLIGNIQDISKLQDLEKKLDEQNNIQIDNSAMFRLFAKLSYDGIWDWNLLTNDFFLGEGFREIFGATTRKDKKKMASDWSNYLHPEDKEAVESGMAAAIASSASRWEQDFRFIKTDAAVANVFCRANIIRDAEGKAIRMIGVVHDLSRQKELEDKLGEEMGLKELQIKEATADAKEEERSIIGKELHDNINQLLGASKLYLDLAKRDGVNSEVYLNRSYDCTRTAIEEIRKLSKGLTTDIINNLGLCDAIINISRVTMEINPIKISTGLGSFSEKSVDNKFKLNIYRIVQEQLNNIIKHSDATEASITVMQSKKTITLKIADNGVGFDVSQKSNGIGLANIKSRAAAYNAKAVFSSAPGMGCELTVKFPVTDHKGK